MLISKYNNPFLVFLQNLFFKNMNCNTTQITAKIPVETAFGKTKEMWKQPNKKETTNQKYDQNTSGKGRLVPGMDHAACKREMGILSYCRMSTGLQLFGRVYIGTDWWQCNGYRFMKVARRSCDSRFKLPVDRPKLRWIWLHTVQIILGGLEWLNQERDRTTYAVLLESDCSLLGASIGLRTSAYEALF